MSLFHLLSNKLQSFVSKCCASTVLRSERTEDHTITVQQTRRTPEASNLKIVCNLLQDSMNQRQKLSQLLSVKENECEELIQMIGDLTSDIDDRTVQIQSLTAQVKNQANTIVQLKENAKKMRKRKPKAKSHPENNRVHLEFLECPICIEIIIPIPSR